MRLFFVVLSALALAGRAPLTAQEPVAVFDAAWRIVDEEHFDPRHNGVDWDAVRTELRPRAVRAEAEPELRAVIGEMLGRLGQSHFSLIPREALGRGSAGSAPGTCEFDLRWIEDSALVVDVDAGGVAARAGVRTGWQLLAVDGDSVQTILEEPHEKPTLRFESLVWVLLRRRVDGDIGTSVTLDFEDGQGKRQRVELERTRRAGIPFDMRGLPTFYLTIETEAILDVRSIGVVRFSNWFHPLMDSLHEELVRLRACDGIVIDLRGNTGGDGSIARKLASHFFAERVSLGTQRMRDGDLSLAVRPLRSFRNRRVQPFLGPVAILTDATTGSCSEVFAGGMQALGRARVIGTRTAGAALPSHLSKLPNGDYLLHAIADFLTVKGESMEGGGVVPDEDVATTRRDLLEGRDPALDAAVAWIGRETGRDPSQRRGPPSR